MGLPWQRGPDGTEHSELAQVRRHGPLRPLLVAAAALAVCCAIVLVSGRSPVAFLICVFRESLGRPGAIAATLLKATPLILTGLAFSVAFRAGYFNIGAEAQLLAGGMVAAIAGHALRRSGGLPATAVCFCAAALAGALLAYLPVLLKERRGVHEVLTYICLYYVALRVGNWLVTDSAMAASGTFARSTPPLPASVVLAPTVTLGKGGEVAEFRPGILIAVGACIAVYAFFTRTWPGYCARVLGRNRAAAECYDMRPERCALAPMAIAGASAGLAGALLALEVFGCYTYNFSAQYGFKGIVVGLIAVNRPLLIPAAGFLLAMLEASDTAVQAEVGLAPGLVLVISAVAMWFAASLAEGRGVRAERI